MPAKTSRNIRVRLANSVIEARAGLIPASDDLADEIVALMNHAAQLLRSLGSHMATPERASEQRAVREILTTLLQYCDFKYLNFRDLVASAHAEYIDESQIEPYPPIDSAND